MTTTLIKLALLTAAPLAQAQAPADSVRVLDEVSVTAIKSSLTSSRALGPVSSTVVTSDEIERLGILTMKNVSEIAPNFYIPDYGTRMTSSIYVRGIGARIDQPVVGLNVDNVPFLNKDNYDFDLVDIDRIEVLRGPQSTLYGRNTMGGVVNITTLSPMRWRGLRVMAEAATGTAFRGSVGYYFGVSDRAAMSVNLYGSYLGGYFKNDYSGARADREENFSARWKTQWRPTSDVTLENTAAISLSRQHGYPYAFAETGRIAYNDTCFYRRTGLTDGLTVNWHISPRVKLSSITSYQYLDDNMTLDQDFLPLSYFTLTQRRHEWALTQDFVARGTMEAYSWLGGLFGFWKNTDMSAPVTFKEHGIAELIVNHRNEANPYYPIAWNEDRFRLNSHFSTPTRGIAVYHRSELNLGNLQATLDLRLDHEAVTLNYQSWCHSSYSILDGPGGDVMSVVDLTLDNPGRLSKSFTQLLPKLTLSYTLPMPSSMIYASVAKGYKAGGYNTQMFSDVLQQRVMETMGITAKYDVDEIVSYDPEKSWNYEIGARLSTLDSRLSGEVSLFYIDCRDQQLTMFPEGTTTGRIMANAGKTRSYGAEVSARWSPGAGLRFQASYGFTSAKFVEFDNGREDYSGKRVPYAPQNTFFIGATWIRQLNRRFELEANVNGHGVGDIYWDEINQFRQPFYMQLGASLTLRARRWSVDLWGENLTDTRFDTFSYVSISNRFFQRGKPVRGGVTFRLILAQG